MSPLCIPFLPVSIVQQRSAGPVHWNSNLYTDLSINALKFVHMMSTCWILSLSFTDVLDRPLEGVLHSEANSLCCSMQAFYLWVLQSTVHFGCKPPQNNQTCSASSWATDFMQQALCIHYMRNWQSSTIQMYYVKDILFLFSLANERKTKQIVTQRSLAIATFCERKSDAS
jgi:hypothetical protein